MVTAYLRVSTGKQHLENQQSEITRYAALKGITVDRWVTETISGKTDKKERKLGALLKTLKTGDTLIVTEVSRLSRTLHEIMTIMGECLKKNITIYSTKDGYAFDDSINSKVLCFAFSLVAEIEHSLISRRTKEALALRRAEGVVLGRRKGSCPKLDMLIQNKHDIICRLNSGNSMAEICRHYGVSVTVFNKLRKRYKTVDKLVITGFGEARYAGLVEKARVMNEKLQKKRYIENASR